MKYIITHIVECNDRLGLIKNMKATALYYEDEVTDEQFEKMANGELPMPNIETKRFADMDPKPKEK
jgi:hypothetical protein